MANRDGASPLTVTAIQHRPGGDRLMAQDAEGTIWRSGYRQSWAPHQREKGCTVFVRKMAGGDWITCTCKVALVRPMGIPEIPFPHPNPKDPWWGR